MEGETRKEGEGEREEGREGDEGWMGGKEGEREENVGWNGVCNLDH